ncbi:dihydrofolate reductase [Gracilibacillus marinus]|uniref:Dihydrofolate reductase n=1 Tax=Gracilibacillus marinus TaxID=630535 RepID=A0ABV8VXU0_9BACI
MLSLIFAMDQNRVIGKDNQLPWHLPNDLKFFKEKTIHHKIIMGRKTYESMGGALPKRENIVLTRDAQFANDDCKVIHDIDSIHQLQQENPEEEIFIIGGVEIFKQVLSFADRIYMTKIHAEFDGDTFFPLLNEDEWMITSKTDGMVDEKNKYPHTFIQLERKNC